MPKSVQVDEEQLVNFYVNEGKKTKEIAKIMGISPATAQRKLKKLGVLKSSGRKPKADINEIRRLYIDENKTMDEVAEELGVNRFTIYQALKNAGVKKDKQAIRKTYESTMMERYNARVPMQSDELKSKIQETNEATYGAKSPLASKSFRESSLKVTLIKAKDNSKFMSDELAADIMSCGVLKFLLTDCNFSLDSAASIVGCSIENVLDSIDKHDMRYEDASDKRKVPEGSERKVPSGFFDAVLTEDFLNMYFIDKNMRRQEIAELLGCSDATVKKSLRKYSIEKDRKKTQELIEKSNMEKRGVKTNMMTEEFREQSREACLEKYGYEHSSQSPIVRQKAKETSLRKYGYDNPSKSPEIITKIKEYQRDPEHIEANRQKRVRHYQETYGELVTHQSLIHIKHIEYWADFEHWAREAYKSARNTLLDKNDISGFFGVTRGTLNAKIRETNTQDLFHTDASEPEYKWMQWLSDQGIPYKIHDRDVLSGQEIDILINEYNLGIEINPSASHNTEICVYAPKTGVPKDKLYHQNKSVKAEENGINIIHVFDWSDEELVKEHILSLVSEKKPIDTFNGQFVIDGNNISYVDETLVLSADYVISDSIMTITGFDYDRTYDVSEVFIKAIAMLIDKHSDVSFVDIPYDYNFGRYSELAGLSSIESSTVLLSDPKETYGNVYENDNIFFRCKEDVPNDKYKTVYDAGTKTIHIDVLSFKS